LLFLLFFGILSGVIVPYKFGHDKHKITQQRDNGSEKRNQGMMEAKKGWGLLKGQQPRSMVN
jgi:hypothetical protein